MQLTDLHPTELGRGCDVHKPNGQFGLLVSLARYTTPSANDAAPIELISLWFLPVLRAAMTQKPGMEVPSYFPYELAYLQKIRLRCGYLLRAKQTPNR